MKKLSYLLFTLALVLTACIDGDHDAPNLDVAPYGNNAITDENVITIQQLKDDYKQYVTTSYTYQQITDDIKIKAYVTGNDAEGNIYNEVSLQDETGAIIVAVQQSGIHGYLAEGTQIIVSLKDLYIGNYGQQAEIGVPYTNAKGSTYVSRMPSTLWQQHFKIVGYQKDAITPVEYDATTIKNWNGYDDGGKLATLKGVTIRNATSTTTWADVNASTSTSLYFTEITGSNYMVYTSMYADFASVAVPQQKFNITGIFKNYNGKCEIIIRKISDIEVATEE